MLLVAVVVVFIAHYAEIIIADVVVDETAAASL